MATFDVLLSATARAFIESLAPQDQAAVARALDLLSIDPLPDGLTKTYLPVPYAPGSLAFTYGDFWFLYVLLAGWCIRVHSVYWAPGSSRRPG